MRIARVLVEGYPQPLCALERDGAVYDVAELDRTFGTRFSPERLALASDFHARVVALGGAGLDELDQRLLAGDRPSAARLLPGCFVWLPPCDTERALHVQMAPYDASLAEPSYRIGNARGLLGHDAAIPLQDPPDLELGVAAVLREDVTWATPAEAERAILGYTILNGWAGGGLMAQLGPVLVTAGEAGDLGAMRAQACIDGQVVLRGSVSGWAFSIAESIAWVSRWIDLRAGDVIGAGRVRGAQGITPAHEARVELAVARLGTLRGRAVRGRDPRRGWRSE